MYPQKRSPPSPSSTSINDLKTRVITCLNKLSDRDTLFLATAELETIAKTLTTHDAFSSFLTCIHNTDSSSKSPVRKHCVNLLTLLSNSHGNSLSPHLAKMISTLTRRLRDSDSAVRSACIEAITAMSSKITKPPFSLISKPLIQIMTIEKHYSSQIGSAMCLAAAIEAAPEPEVEQLKRVLPKLGKLVKDDGFKPKSALLNVIGSIVSVGGANSKRVLDWLMPCLVEFLSCNDWSARKVAAEVLGKVALVEKKLAKEYKLACFSCLENKRFDKVKAVRETMNRTLQLWKEVADVSDEVSVPFRSKSSSIDDANSESFSSASDDSVEVGFKSPLPKKIVHANRSPPLDVSSLVTNFRKQSPIMMSRHDNSKTAILPKMDDKKTSAWQIELARSQNKGGFEDNIKMQDSGCSESWDDVNNAKHKSETRRVLFGSIRDDELHKFGGLRYGSRVFPCNDDDRLCNKEDGKVNNPNEELLQNSKDIEDLSLIRDQLIQIENQQSNLLDLLQKFIGSSKHGISSLETRVHGLEMALDEISYDLARSSGRLPSMDSADNTCCKLPGTEFLSTKFWRKTDHRYSTLRFSSPENMQPLHTAQNICDLDSRTETSQHHGRNFARRNLGFYSGEVTSDIIQDDGQVRNGHQLSEASSASYTVTMNVNGRLSP